MKQHRFIGPYDLRNAEIVLEDSNARQMALVLKLKAGEKVVLCDGKGTEAEFEILEVKKGVVMLRKNGDVLEVMTESDRAVTLYLAILKRENFELVVQKATECGVARIVPLVTRRTIKKEVKIERLREIAREASEQSGRGVVPIIDEPMSFVDALEEAKETDAYFFDFGGKEFEAKSLKKNVSLFVGPEGGWDPEERADALESRMYITSLGPRVLRGETAAIVAVYSVLA